jgi:hypothetical protein
LLRIHTCELENAGDVLFSTGVMERRVPFRQTSISERMASDFSVSSWASVSLDAAREEFAFLPRARNILESLAGKGKRG